jgi:hypothetical protein
LKQDIRYGVRTLAMNPGFTATAVLSLALGTQQRSLIWLILRGVLTGPGRIARGGQSGYDAAVRRSSERCTPPAGAAMTLVAATTVAAYLPARRAARLDPTMALREE